ncbi:MAG: hypothetical protein ACLP5E_07175 [Streptosporangiaceae bacterium]
MASTVKRAGGARLRAALTYGVVTAVMVAGGGFTFWYRATYNVLPGQGASTRLHWCGRDYQSSDGSPQTWRQISAQQRAPIRALGHYPPLGVPGQELFAPAAPGAQRFSVSPPLPCAMVVYLRTGPGEYLTYVLEGGP